MAKRLTRTDYIFTLIFIFMLVCAIAAFFYGLKIGKENTEMKYEELLRQQEEIPLELTAYHQQYLVSFYHTIYLPYRDFQKKWFEHMNSIELRSNTTDVESVLKDLGKLANHQYQQMINKAMPDASPLLQQSHEDLLKSLKLFAEAVKQPGLKKLQGAELLSEIKIDTFFQEAKEFALSAQYKYYASIVRWNQSNNPQMQQNLDFIEVPHSIVQWNELNLNEKNSIIAFMMMEDQYYEPFYAHDVTLRVDELIQNGQAEKMNLQFIHDIMETLIDTRAIRVGDFLNGRDRYYEDETLPQLPFFFE
jgi:hypothetical protein